MKQKGHDYKITAVKYYLNNNDTMDNTCKIFNCKKPSLHRWLQIYKTKKNLQRKLRKSISYKVKKEQVKTYIFVIYNLYFVIHKTNAEKKPKTKNTII
jgi:transposase-like protein